MANISNTWNKHSTNEEYKTLFTCYYAPLCAYANKIVNSKEQSEELVQDIFIKLWENKQGLSIEHLKAYLYTSVYKRSLHIIKHNTVHERYKAEIKHQKQHYPSPEDGMIMNEMYLAYQQELEALPEKTKEIYLLSRTDGLRYKSIAEQLNISVKTVEAHISKALKAFRIRFEKVNKN